MFNNTAVTPLEIVGKIAEAYGNAKSAEGSSLVDFTRVAQVEPIVLMDRNSTTLPYITDILQTLTSQFAAYYLQAVALKVNVGQIETRKLLESLNPNRDGRSPSPFDNYVNKKLGLEDFKFKLPQFDKPNFGLEALETSSRTRTTTSRDETMPDGTRVNVETENEYVDTKGPTTAAFARDLGASITPVGSLATGVILDVSITSNGQKATIPVTVRLAPNAVPPETMAHILGADSKDLSFKERWHSYRSGEITFWKDLVLCQDLIDAHEDALKKDKSGVYMAILERRRRSVVSSIATQNPSIATASNLIVMTKETAARLEANMGSRLSSTATRERIFRSTYMMIMAVIDTEREMVTFYTRGISIPATFSVRGIKAANKGGGPDVAEILRAYQLGNSPSL